RSLINESGQYYGHVMNKKYKLTKSEVAGFAQAGGLLSGIFFRELAAYMQIKSLDIGYEGPASLDLFIGEYPDGSPVLVLSEINLRNTLGRIAYVLEKKIARGSTAIFSIK